MSEPAGDHEARIRVLEQQIQELREQIAHVRGDAAAARVLAGGADRDVADMRAQLRAHTQALNALRETQLEQGGEIGDLRAEMRAEFADVRREMGTGFATLHTGMAHITRLLEGLSGPKSQ